MLRNTTAFAVAVSEGYNDSDGTKAAAGNRIETTLPHAMYVVNS